MSEHVCKAPTWPTSLTEKWTCECGKVWRAMDVNAEMPAKLLRHVPPATLGWTTREIGEAP